MALPTGAQTDHMLTKYIRAKFNGLDNYGRALLVGIPLTAALLAFLFSIGASELLMDQWIIDLICTPIFIANLLAIFAYSGRTVDMVKMLIHPPPPDKPKSKYELLFTVLGFGLGLAVGISLAYFCTVIPFVTVLNGFSYVLFAVRQVIIFTGLGNRLGRVVDKGSRPKIEKAFALAATLIGIAAGIVLVTTGTAGMITVVGITSFFSLGAAIPVWIASAIFVVTLASSLASTADYSAKAIDFIRAYTSKRKNFQEKYGEKIKTTKFHEYRGSITGITIGLIIGSVLVGVLAVSQPYLFAGIVGVVAAMLVITTCAGITGSICSRIGRFIDSYKNIKVDAAEKDLEKGLEKSKTSELEKDLKAKESKLDVVISKTSEKEKHIATIKESTTTDVRVSRTLSRTAQPEKRSSSCPPRLHLVDVIMPRPTSPKSMLYDLTIGSKLPKIENKDKVVLSIARLTK